MADHTLAEIAGVRLAAACDTGIVLRQPLDVYQPFLRTGTVGADVEISIVFGPGDSPGLAGAECLLRGNDSWSAFERAGSRILSLEAASSHRDPVWRAQLYPGWARATVYYGPELVMQRATGDGIPAPFWYPLDQILMMYYLATRRGALVHAAGGSVGGKGLIFPGVSGAGKSTLTRQIMAGKPQDIEMLSDDRMIVRKIDGNFKAYGTPWPGDAGIAVNKSVPLRAMLFLHRGKQNEIRELTPQQALEQLLPVASIPWYDRDVLPDILDFCDDLITNVPSYELHFRPEPGVVDLLASFAAGL